MKNDLTKITVNLILCNLHSTLSFSNLKHNIILRLEEKCKWKHTKNYVITFEIDFLKRLKMDKFNRGKSKSSCAKSKYAWTLF